MIHYDSIHDVSITVPASDEDLLGKVCYFATDGNLQIAPEGIPFVGVCTQVRNGLATLQVHGVVTMPYSNSTPSRGPCKFSANFYGGVLQDSNGKEYLVLDVDEANKTVTFFM